MKARSLIASLVLSLVVPVGAAAQDRDSRVSLHGSAGALINETGTNQAISVGFWPNARVGILISAERLHVPTETTTYENGFSRRRGGTTTFLGGEIRWLPLSAHRVSPYVLAGIGRGVSRPNVNEFFPDEVSNDAMLMFGGGGIHIPVNSHLNVFADARFMLQVEEDAPYLFVPVRGGISWRF